MRRAFTLIELLIVIAIIAILALIAVPNFLEAQTRAKVSKAIADQRSIATALEAYAVDWGRPPIGQWEASNWDPKFTGLPNGAVHTEAMWSRLTTPVSYMTTIPLDVFSEKGRKNKAGANVTNRSYWYYQYQSVVTYSGGQARNYMGSGWAEAKGKGLHWCLYSWGPSRLFSPYPDWGRDVVLALAKRPSTATRVMYPDVYYDSSNGTISFGYMVRSNLGNP